MVGNGEFNPLPSGNGESTVKYFHLLASIVNQKMIISGYTDYAFSLYKYNLSISRCETQFKWVIPTFDLVSQMKLPNSKDELNLYT